MKANPSLLESYLDTPKWRASKIDFSTGIFQNIISKHFSS